MKTIHYNGIYNTVPKEIFTSKNTLPNKKELDKWAKDIATKIINKLEAIKMPIDKAVIELGAITTTIKLKPADHIRTTRFKNVTDDVSRAAGVECRIIPLIKDTEFVGIEVPTPNKSMVTFRDVYHRGINDEMELPISLGVKSDGSVLGFDLARMPHLLVAGASGQGKSVGLNVIMMSLLSTMHPVNLNIHLIDPKEVEFADYERLKDTGIVKSIDTTAQEAENTLDYLCAEMDARYTYLKNLGYRKISDYNNNKDIDAPILPYKVCIIDEFSDFIMGADKTLEQNIIRIAQKGRAAGIHLIIATQRPDKDVISGLIKANFPTRIAFRTATGTDSRIILDSTGAEQLTGNGDMLMSFNGMLTRAQCAYVSDSEIKNAVNHCVEQLETFTIVEQEEGIQDERKQFTAEEFIDRANAPYDDYKYSYYTPEQPQKGISARTILAIVLGIIFFVILISGVLFDIIFGAMCIIGLGIPVLRMIFG